MSATQENKDESVKQEGGSIANVTRVNITDKSKLLIVSVLIAANLIATVWMFIEWKMAERESRLLEYYVMELDGKMMAADLVKPPESWSGRKQK